MAYRTIGIGFDTYQYSVGKSHVHIKGGKLTKPLVFKKADVGEKIEWTCECCGEPMSRIGYRADEIRYSLAVTPGVVRNLVLAHLPADAAAA